MRKLCCILCLVIIALYARCVASADEKYSFSVGGIIRALPGNGRAANEIVVKHENIPDYRDETGAVVGMMPMTMPFYLSEGVSVTGLQVGDKIEMVVEQRIKPKFSEQVVTIKKIS